MAVITTEAVPLQDRFDYWREVISQCLFDLRMEPWKERPLYGTMAIEMIGDLALSDVSGPVCKHYHRTRRDIARSPLPYYFVSILRQGPSFVRRGETEIAISAGDAVVYDTLHEMELGFLEPARVLTIRIPKEWIASRVRQPEGIHGTVIGRDRPLSPLLRSYLTNGFETARRLTADAASMFSQHAVELIAHAVGEIPNQLATSSAWREALFVRACRLIALHFADPELGPDTVAGKLGVSTRLLQRIFAEREHTVMKRIFEERIRRAAKLLADPDAANRSITDIAFSCGFNDSAHFTRAFAARKGVTPSHWRKQGR